MAQKISNLANKSKIKYGSLHGKPIVWIIGDKNHSGYPANSVSLVTNQIIKMLCFDATEPSNSDSNRRSYGNNRYIYSNLRQWLNSAAGAGAWYTAQHSADQAPDASHVWNNVNPYSTLAGFSNAFTADERALALDTTITVGKASVDGGGTETCIDKFFPLSCTEVGLSGDAVCGSRWAIFSDNTSRVATVTAECVANSNYSSNPSANAAWYYWLRDAYAGSSYNARRVHTDGTLYDSDAYNGSRGLRVACNLNSEIFVSDTTDADGCYTIIYNHAPTAPGSIDVPAQIIGGETVTIQWGQSTDADGNLAGYILEQKNNSNGTWTQVFKGNARTKAVTIEYGLTSVQFRVKAYDTANAESGYTTSAVRTVINNRPPVISGADSDLGSFAGTPPAYEYTVSDADGDTVTVTEKLDGVPLRTFTATLDSENTLTLSAEAWAKVLNGAHTLAITATDTKGDNATRSMTLTKAVSTIELVQTLAMAADDMPTKALVNIQGNFPTGCVLHIWICNNGNDAAPVWEDITAKVTSNVKHFFTNAAKTASDWGVKVKVRLERGTATDPCFITSIGGFFG